MKVEFLKKSELQARINRPMDWNNLPDVLLCYVEYSADFVVQGPAGSPPTHYGRVAQVFDAHTGNVLLYNAYDLKK